jgi:phosphoribosyl 1,2-cyclic phosphate phosphodiesterase
MSLKITILGSGSSGGVPRIGNDWGACDPSNPKNRRSRCSLLVEKMEPGAARPTRVMIDTSPDMREQLLRADVSELDAVLYSHDHADQTHGIDDLRVVAFATKQRVPVYMDEATSRLLTQRFAYCFNMPEGSAYPAILDERRMPPPGEPLSIKGPAGEMAFVPLLQRHGSMPSLGFRIGAFAYSNDVSDIPEETFERLHGLDLWILDTLRYAPHPTHVHLEKALQWVETVRAKRTILTNLHIDLDYEKLKSELPIGVEPAFDGLTVEIPLD